MLRIQPDEAVYLKCSVKAPGLDTRPTTSELDLSYKSRFGEVYAPDAYTRLILEALRPRSQVNRDFLVVVCILIGLSGHVCPERRIA